MNDVQRARELCNDSPSGIITSKQFTEAQIHPSAIQKLLESGEIYKYARGLYVRYDAWEDQLYLLQKRYPKGIFSHDTALFLLQYSDRHPIEYTMTFPRGYHADSLKDSGIRVKYASPENYSLGVIEITSPCGNPIRVYDLEHTLCDIVHKQHYDVQIVLPALRQYAWSREKNLIKLDQYAKKLHVANKIDHYMEILLE